MQCAQVAAKQVELISEVLSREQIAAEKKFAEVRMRKLRGTEYKQSIEQAQGAGAAEAFANMSSSSPFQHGMTQNGAESVKELEPEDWDKLHVAAKLPEEPDTDDEDEQEEKRRKEALMEAMRQAAKIGMFGTGDGKSGEAEAGGGASTSTAVAASPPPAAAKKVAATKKAAKSAPNPAAAPTAKDKTGQAKGQDADMEEDLSSVVKAVKKKKKVAKASKSDPDDLAGALKKKKTKKAKKTK